MSAPLSLWLVEDHALYRAQLRALLDSSDAFRLTEAFPTFGALDAHLDGLPEGLDGHSDGADGADGGRLGWGLPDLVLMDLHLPEVDGFDATRRLSQRCPGLPIVALTVRDDPGSVVAALRAGASGYVVKGTEPERLFLALWEAHHGGTYFAPDVAAHVLGHFAPPRPVEPLSGRELEVLRELADGHTKAVIGERMFLSPHTVDSHLRNIYRKLHARTAAQAAAVGVREGLID